MDFSLLLSPELQSVLDGMMRGGGTAFGRQLLQMAGGRVARHFRTPERQAALLRAVRNAFAAALSHWAIDEAVEGHYVAIFEDWLGREEVLSEFSLLLTPSEDEGLDIELLCEEFEATGYSAETLLSVPFSELLLDMVGAFYVVAAEEKELQEPLKIGLLRQMAERMGALDRMKLLAEQQLAVSQQGVDELRLIREHSEKVLSGQGLTNQWLERIERVLRQRLADGITQQQLIYQAVQTLLARAYDVPLDTGSGLEGRIDQQVRAQLQPVLGLLGEIRDQLSGQEGLDAAQLAEMEVAYRQTIKELFETLTFKGISPSGRAIALPLAEVYVELKAVADVPEAADTYSAPERRLLVEAEERGLDERELGMQLDTLRYERWKERGRQPSQQLQRRSIHETLADPAQRGVVILGDPGSGKTTLLYYLALRAATEEPPTTGQLPIFVPLAAYDDYLMRTQSHLPLGQFLAIYYEKWHSLPALEPLFSQAVAEGRAFLLLDGLDEVLERSTRQFVSKQVEGLIQQWAAKGNRFALTSRVVGYREAPLTGNLPHVTVLDFGRQEIERFAEQWCLAYERWVADGKETQVVKQRAAREKEALLSDVRANASIERLAASPLLLTMLALLRRQVGKLPDRRIKLYERYVETLIDNWQLARSEGARQQAPQRFDVYTALAHLIDLALWLQQHKPSGTTGRHELDHLLQTICLRFDGHDPATAPPKVRVEAQKEAERFRKDMRHFAGLLVERGRDAFGFLHLTFQEYFVGRALARMTAQERWQTIQPHLHSQRWREPIMLCAGQLGIIEQRRNLVDDLLHAILHAKSEHEPILHRDLFLASAIVTDDVAPSLSLLDQLAQRLIPLQQSPIPTIRDTALAGLAQLARLRHQQAMTALLTWLEDDQLQRHVIEAVKAVLAAEACKPLRDALQALLDDPSERVRLAAVQTLLPLAASDQSLQAALLGKLDDPNWGAREAAVMLLSPQRPSSEHLQDTLLGKLDDPDWRVRQAAVRVLLPLAASSERLQNALLGKLDDPDSRVRQVAVKGISQLTTSSECLLNALLDKLNDPDWGVREAAVRELSPMVASSQHVQDALLEKLDDPSEWVRSAVASWLSPLVTSSERLLNALLEKLYSPDSEVRQTAVSGLGRLAASSERARNTLYTLLEDPSESIRQAAVEGFIPLVTFSEREQTALYALLDDPSEWVRLTVVEGLLPLIVSSERAQRVLYPLLDDPSEWVRLAAVEKVSLVTTSSERFQKILLGKLDGLSHNIWQARKENAQTLIELVASSERVQDYLLDLLHDRHWKVRLAAVMGLSPLAGSSKRVQDALRGKLDDPDSDVREAVMAGLSPLAASSECVQDVRPGQLHDAEERVGHAAVAEISSLATSSERVQDTLLSQLHNPNSNVRLAAVQRLAALVGQDDEITRHLIPWLGVVIEDEELFSFNKAYKSRETRYLLAHAYAPFLENNRDLLDKVVQMLDSPAWPTRQGAAWALIAMPGGPSEHIMDKILNLINDTRGEESWRERLQVAQLFINDRDRGLNERVIAVALEALDFATQPWCYMPELGHQVRQQAVYILGELEPLYRDEKVFQRLARVLEEDEDAEVRDAAYGALLRLAAAPEEGEGVIG